MADGSDFARYVDARWPDLVGGLEDEGVPADDARLAVAGALAGTGSTTGSWARPRRRSRRLGGVLGDMSGSIASPGP